jgi:hypothetical protein
MKIKDFKHLINKYIRNKKEYVYLAEQDNHRRTVDTPNLYVIKNLGEKNINGQKCKVFKVKDTAGTEFLDIRNYNFGL